MDFNLDFNIETSEERKNFIDSKDLSNLTKKELELCANYILYGKDPEQEMTSIVDRKEVFIKTKFSSYSKKEPVSLDALLENPAFNEGIFLNNNTVYKKVKPSIDKEKAKEVPGMQELWRQIESIEQDLENFKEDTKKKYYFKHLLIDLKRQQYYLMDSVSQTLPRPQNKGQYFGSIVDQQMNYYVLPRGVMRNESDKEFENPLFDSVRAASTPIEDRIESFKKTNKYYFDFFDKDHVYKLIVNYWDLKLANLDVPDSPLHNLLWTLDFYIRKADLNEQQRFIIDCKKMRMPNRDITAAMKKKFGFSHQENYISTIWNKSIQLINEAAALNYDEWLCKDFKKAWKKCNCCGEFKLRDPRNFVRKTKAPDGLTNCCKKCDRLKRQKKKEGQ